MKENDSAIARAMQEDADRAAINAKQNVFHERPTHPLARGLNRVFAPIDDLGFHRPSKTVEPIGVSTVASHVDAQRPFTPTFEFAHAAFFNAVMTSDQRFALPIEIHGDSTANYSVYDGLTTRTEFVEMSVGVLEELDPNAAIIYPDCIPEYQENPDAYSTATNTRNGFIGVYLKGAKSELRTPWRQGHIGNASVVPYAKYEVTFAEPKTPYPEDEQVELKADDKVLVKNVAGLEDGVYVAKPVTPAHDDDAAHDTSFSFPEITSAPTTPEQAQSVIAIQNGNPGGCSTHTGDLKQPRVLSLDVGDADPETAAAFVQSAFEGANVYEKRTVLVNAVPDVTIPGPAAVTRIQDEVVATFFENVSLQGLWVNGIAYLEDSVVIATGQTAILENGVYRVKTGAWERVVEGEDDASQES